MAIYSGFFDKNSELEESRKLYYSFLSGKECFDECFAGLFDIDYHSVFGKKPREDFLFDILKLYYHNDFFVRRSFAKKVLEKSEAICFEELPLNNSRLDLASINGKSIAYEIKTEYDNYKKLQKQLDDYSTCFEYVYVICPLKKLKHIVDVVPDYCGIFLYRGSGNISFFKYKSATKSLNLNPSVMLNVLREKEKTTYFRTNDTSKIINRYSKAEINKLFKKALKNRYKQER